MSKSKYSKRKNPYDINKWHPRDVINARLEALGKTKYWLVARAGSSEAVVYRFLSGEAETSWGNTVGMLAGVGIHVGITSIDDPVEPSDN